MNFAYPALLTLPLLYLAAKFFLRKKKQLAAPFPSSDLVKKITPSWRVLLRMPTLETLGLLTIVALSLAAARPQRELNIEQPKKARNIVLALDVSRSMEGRDFLSKNSTTSRSEGVKMVVSEYVRERANDRIGLVVFGGNAYLQCPLTNDLQVVLDLVSVLTPGMAGDGTAIGDGLGVALKHIREIDGETKAIILLTDGDNNAGEISPLQAAKVARDLGIKIHTIGIGSTDTPLGQGIFGGMFTLPNQPMAGFDETTLKEIAKTTGGVYFNAESIDGLREVYAEIEKLTESDTKENNQHIVEELFAPYALTALISFLLLLLLANTVFLRVP